MEESRRNLQFTHIYNTHKLLFLQHFSQVSLYSFFYETPNNLLLMILHVMSLIIIIILHVFVIYLNCLEQIVNNSESLQMMKALRNRECRMTQNQSSHPSQDPHDSPHKAIRERTPTKTMWQTT